MPTAQQIQDFFDQSRNVIIAGIRTDGTAHLTPTWFSFDGNYIYVSTTRKRVKYRMFKRDPRVTVVVDNPADRKYVSFRGTVDVREDLENLLPIFRRTREKSGVPVPSDAEFLEFLRGDDRVLLVITPKGPIETWSTKGFDED